MIWIGIAIGIIVSFTFFSVLLIAVKRQTAEKMPKKLEEYWESSLMNQRNLFHATASIADALEEQRAPNINKMVDKFLAWPLPKDFGPDGGISFKNEPDARGYSPTWPVGTNLFTATQAREMFEHVLKTD